MVEMVEILNGRVCNLSVERVRYVIHQSLHLVIVKYGVISLVICISTRLQLVTILTVLLKYIRLITQVSVKYNEIFHEWRQYCHEPKSEMTPYFTMTKCNKLFITYLTRSTERLPSLPSSIATISTISMTVVMTTLFKKR